MMVRCASITVPVQSHLEGESECGAGDERGGRRGAGRERDLENMAGAMRMRSEKDKRDLKTLQGRDNAENATAQGSHPRCPDPSCPPAVTPSLTHLKAAFRIC